MSYMNLTTEGAVGVLTMNHGENRFHPDFLTEMMAHLDEVEADDMMGALVVTGGDPKFFSNGLDLAWVMAHVGDLAAVQAYMAQVNAMFHRWCLYPRPVVAALNGHTFAAGLFMAAHMDFRFMREDRGWCCMPEVDINIPLLPGMIAICQAVMTPQGFHRMYYSGERIPGPQAMELGFVDAVFPEDELLTESVLFASKLAHKKRATYAEMKRRIRADVADTLLNVDPGQFMKTLSFAMPG
jgi:Delta3-Delta2-enoyl-CoA isomerase